jgi:LmbE family N-acetylglucosaminyl deacetylase
VPDDPAPGVNVPDDPAPGVSVPDDPSGQGAVLAVFAHPDDAEIAAGGTLARWATEGRAVHLLVLTNGDRGSEDPSQDRVELARMRAAETEGAGKVLGLSGSRVLDVHDGELENSTEVRAQIVREIRRIRPAVLVTCDPTTWFYGNRYFNHADHRTAGAAALDSVFPGAGNPLFFSEQLAEGLQPWKVPQAWLSWTVEPNHDQDVTGFLETKLAALAAHRSQVEGDLLGFFDQWLPLEAEEAGRRIGVRHAEPFRVMQFD